MAAGAAAIEFKVTERAGGQFNALLTYVLNSDSFTWIMRTARSSLSAAGILKSESERVIYHRRYVSARARVSATLPDGYSLVLRARRAIELNVRARKISHVSIFSRVHHFRESG